MNKKEEPMSLDAIFKEMKRNSPMLPLIRTESAILFEDETQYLIMYSRTPMGEVVHCLRENGYPAIKK